MMLNLGEALGIFSGTYRERLEQPVNSHPRRIVHCSRGGRLVGKPLPLRARLVRSAQKEGWRKKCFKRVGGYGDLEPAGVRRKEKDKATEKSMQRER